MTPGPELCTGAGVSCSDAPAPRGLSSNKWDRIYSCNVCPLFPTLASVIHMHQTFILKELCLKNVYSFRVTSDLDEYNKMCFIQ